MITDEFDAFGRGILLDIFFQSSQGVSRRVCRYGRQRGIARYEEARCKVCKLVKRLEPINLMYPRVLPGAMA